MATRSANNPLILAVDDDSEVRATIIRTLQRDSYDVVEAADARSALAMAREHRPDLIVLDIALADANGFEVCSQLRSLPYVTDIPILFLSVYHSAQHVARALDCGGDDYLRKPFAPRELSARVRALLRRSPAKAPQAQLKLHLYPKDYSVELEDRRVQLTPTEFSLLAFLCRHQDDYHTAGSLLEKLWEYPPGGGDTALVRNHVRNLRRKLEQDPNHPAIVISLHGRGYAVQAQVAEMDEAPQTAPSMT